MKNNALTLAAKDFANVIDTLQAHAKALGTSVKCNADVYNDTLNICYSVGNFNKDGKWEYEEFSVTTWVDEYWKEKYGTSQISSIHYYHDNGGEVLSIHYIDDFDDERKPRISVKYE